MNYFKFDKIKNVEFGVCIKQNTEEILYLIPSAGLVETLQEMLNATREGLNLEDKETMETYEPSQIYPSKVRLKIDITDNLIKRLKWIFEAENIPTDVYKIQEIHGLVYYFCIFRDRERNKLIGVRKATQFKGIIKAKNRLVRIVDDTLKKVEDNIFKLDNDFDFLIFDNNVYIYRSASFEHIANIEEEIRKKAAENVDILHKCTKSIDFLSMNKYIEKHIRAARLIASIKERGDVRSISKKLLKNECKKQKIELDEKKGRLIPKPKHEIPFLQVLDRRRYSTELIDGKVERYKALNRVKV